MTYDHHIWQAPTRKIAGQRSLTVVKASVTAENPCRTVNMTATTYI